VIPNPNTGFNDPQLPVVDYSQLSDDELEEYLELQEALSHTDRMELCRKDFIEFCKYMESSTIVGAHHKIMGGKFNEMAVSGNKRIIINVAPRHGKQIAHDVDVCYNGGFKRHGDLQVGDKVFRPNGEQVEVIGVTDESDSNWVVTISDGTEIRCHGNHEWAVRLRGKWITKETRWFTEILKTGPTKGQQRRLSHGIPGKRGSKYKFQLPNPEALERPERDDLDIHPYLLGVWLGDGTHSENNICFDPRKTEHLKKLELLGFEETRRYKHPNHENVHYVWYGKNQLMPYLRSMCLYKNKHIPERYLLGSINQRMELLAGLIDSDGSVDEKGRVRFVNTNKELLDSFYDLAASLGMMPYWMKPKEPVTSTSGINGQKTVYTIGFQPHIEIPTVVKPITRLAPHKRRSIVKVERKPDGSKGKCIQVDSEDGLYVVGKEMIATHNSFFTSQFLPAWYLGNNPTAYLMNISNTTELATGFGRKVRDIVNSKEYQDVFPDVKIRADSKSAGRWAVEQGGELFAAGVGASVTGRGADLLIIDDPYTEQCMLQPSVFDDVWEYYQAGPRQRLMPNGNILVVQTRWSTKDLTGMLVKEQVKNPDADQWELIEFPAIMPSGKALWPEFWSLEALNKVKQSIAPHLWNAQWLQNPTSEEGALIKREWWMRWFKKSPPSCEYIIQAYDTAFSKRDTADYSVISTWGIF